ncbi:MAG: hypothetical protein CMI54_08065 [Parcubacteria group bacterium]|nr:hypothetical protein [Parcubacteria group bacterium]
MRFMFDNLKKVHLPFFLSFPFLSLFVINSHIIEFGELVWVVVACCIVGAVVTAFVKSRKTILFISISFMLFYIFGHIRLVLLDTPELWHIADSTLPIFTMSIAIIAFAFWKRHADFKRATYFANIAGLALVLIAVIQIGLFADQQPQFTATAVDANLQGTPNILYIIPDGYARSDILLDVYGYDNSPFENSLKDMGFTIGHGFSNYVHTHLSLSSILNMQYLDPTDWNLDYGTENHQYAKQMIEDNSVMKTLKENGYTLINIDSQFEATRSNPLFDHNLCSTSATDNELLILFSNTALVPRGFGLQGDQHENRLCAFDNVPYGTGSAIEPYFVMMHIVMPHPPYLFDADGNRLEATPFSFGMDWDGRDKWDTHEAYIGYLEFFNQNIIDTISQFDGLIIIQSDHGTHQIEWDEVEDRQVYNRMANFVATNIEEFDPDLTPVNTWRQVFGLPLLEDRYYFSEYKKSYDFTDYTDIINGLE